MREGHPCCKGGKLPAPCATRRTVTATVARRVLAWSIPFPGLEATGLEGEPAGGAGDRGWARRRRGQSRGGSMRPGRRRAGAGVGEGACGYHRYRHRWPPLLRPHARALDAELRFRGHTLTWPARTGQDLPAQLCGSRGHARGSRARRGGRAR
jgi:hypothetical protein